jgi:hypothetical protein
MTNFSITSGLCMKNIIQITSPGLMTGYNAVEKISDNHLTVLWQILTVEFFL